MKRFRIPLISKVLVVYRGADEWPKFVKRVEAAGATRRGGEGPDEPPVGDAGRQWGGWIWFGEDIPRETLFHELSHFMNALMEHINSTDDEFRAYLTGVVFERVMAWYEQLKDGPA